MSAQHTPGPWDVRTLENFGFNVVHYVNGDKFDIQRVAKTTTSGDARLIAAAPDLLASVIELLEPLERASAELVSHGKVADQNAEAAFDRAHAAIAKARGAA